VAYFFGPPCTRIAVVHKYDSDMWGCSRSRVHMSTISTLHWVAQKLSHYQIFKKLY